MYGVMDNNKKGATRVHIDSSVYASNVNNNVWSEKLLYLE